MTDPLLHSFLERAGLGTAPSLVEVVEAIRSIPYGRPSVRDAAHVVLEWRGTCSTKHSLLVRVVEALWPEMCPEVVHRVYRVTRQSVASPDVALVVPEEGLVDVHRFVVLSVGSARTIIDVTFAGRRWDGRSSMSVACGPGSDEVSVGDPDKHKAELESRYCDPQVREPFIAALAERAPTAHAH